MYTLGASVRTAVGVAAAEISLPMAKGRQYRFTSNTDCYILVTNAGGTAATAGSGSHLVVSGQQVLVGALTETLNLISVIRSTADGFCTLSEVAALPSG